MPWSGGIFTPLWSWVVDSVSNPNILASRFDTYEDDQATGINTCLTKDGQNAATANLPMGGFTHTGVGNATVRSQYAVVGQVQDGVYTTSTDTGSANAYAIIMSPAITTYAIGQTFWFKAINANSGASTLNVNSTGVKTIKNGGTTDLTSGQITANSVYGVYYDGTNFQLLNPTVTVVVPSEIVTGDISWSWVTAKTGWILASGSIGSAASSATNRANADTSDLYTLFWNNLTNTEAPVSGGRGANAAADFAANKTLTVPDGRGRSLIGKDDMNGTSANRITVAGCGVDGDVLGTSGGSEFSQLHNHTAAVTDAGHAHTVPLQEVTGFSAGGGGSKFITSNSTSTSTNTTGITVANTAYGTGTSQNLQPSLVANMFYKL